MAGWVWTVVRFRIWNWFMIKSCHNSWILLISRLTLSFNIYDRKWSLGLAWYLLERLPCVAFAPASKVLPLVNYSLLSAHFINAGVCSVTHSCEIHISACAVCGSATGWRVNRVDTVLFWVKKGHHPKILRRSNSYEKCFNLICILRKVSEGLLRYGNPDMPFLTKIDIFG